GGGGGRQGPPQQGRRNDGKKILEKLARETGGSFFEVTKKMPLESVFDRIEEELRNQYSFGYTSNQTNSTGYRRIHLATAAKRDLIVQTRDGYYADR
ncbi:MAG: VWA domain-containing protein, partial [Bryobacteraceae bacterium]